MRWSLFCRVIDNFGDAGFCLRLARELQARDQQVDLYIDDAGPLAWMQAGDDAVQPLPWPNDNAQPLLGDVVIEAFGCELPTGVQAAMAAQARPPLWINLEYLSAEAYVERSHGLPSPVLSGAARGLVKRFCYPGFSAATAGLLREKQLEAAQRRHQADDWLAAHGIASRPGERRVSLFCYASAPLPALLDALRQQPTLLLVCGDIALPAPLAGVRVQHLPRLSQHDYDRLLWSCDLNLVRGEDSFVRAQWAGKPMLWQLYPQQDGAHRAKLEAYLQRRAFPESVRAGWRCWNGLGDPAALAAALDGGADAAAEALAWREQLRTGPELVAVLMNWAAESATARG